MKRPALLPGLILIGLGLYFLLQQFNVPLFQDWLSWPVIMMIIGAAFIVCALFGWDKSFILPGGILLALGFHFYAGRVFSNWPDHWSMFPGSVGVGFLLAYINTRESSYLYPALILLGIPTFFYFLNGFSAIQTWWPVALIAVGVYILLKKK